LRTLDAIQLVGLDLGSRSFADRFVVSDKAPVVKPETAQIQWYVS
jgi:hypothetical protein